MNNDLISRSELKKAFEKVYPLATNEMGGVVNKQIYDIIDNAPTVEPFEPDYVGKERLEARQRGYEEGYRNGMEIGKTLNPKIKQGEWIITHHKDILGRWNSWYEYKCSVCKHSISQMYDDAYGEYATKFCPNCGADMQKGGEEE